MTTLYHKTLRAQARPGDARPRCGFRRENSIVHTWRGSAPGRNAHNRDLNPCPTF